MPDGVAELIQGIGPLGAFCLALIYLLMRDRRNNKAGNPGSGWQQEMRDVHRETNEKLGRIERALILLLGRMGVDPPP